MKKKPRSRAVVHPTRDVPELRGNRFGNAMRHAGKQTGREHADPFVPFFAAWEGGAGLESQDLFAID